MRPKPMLLKPRCAAPWALAFLLASSGTIAFTFADGKPGSCISEGKTVEEVDADPEQGSGFTGKAVRTASGFVIIWNQARLKTLPPEVHDYVFFHECANALVPTIDETLANCAGLQAMRAADRAGPMIEAKLAAFYGAGSDYWARTLKCANAGPVLPRSR